MEPKKPYKYYAIRYGHFIVFKKTVKGLEKVKSSLTFKHGEKLTKVSYRGGITVGTMQYAKWLSIFRKLPMANYGHLQLSRQDFRAVLPFIYKGE